MRVITSDNMAKAVAAAVDLLKTTVVDEFEKHTLLTVKLGTAPTLMTMFNPSTDNTVVLSYDGHFLHLKDHGGAGEELLVTQDSDAMHQMVNVLYIVRFAIDYAARQHKKHMDRAWENAGGRQEYERIEEDLKSTPSPTVMDVDTFTKLWLATTPSEAIAAMLASMNIQHNIVDTGGMGDDVFFKANNDQEWVIAGRKAYNGYGPSMSIFKRDRGSGSDPELTMWEYLRHTGKNQLHYCLTTERLLMAHHMLLDVRKIISGAMKPVADPYRGM